MATEAKDQKVAIARLSVIVPLKDAKTNKTCVFLRCNDRQAVLPSTFLNPSTTLEVQTQKAVSDTLALVKAEPSEKKKLDSLLIGYVCRANESCTTWFVAVPTITVPSIPTGIIQHSTDEYFAMVIEKLEEWPTTWRLDLPGHRSIFVERVALAAIGRRQFGMSLDSLALCKSPTSLTGQSSPMCIRVSMLLAIINRRDREPYLVLIKTSKDAKFATTASAVQTSTEEELQVTAWRAWHEPLSAMRLIHEDGKQTIDLADGKVIGSPANFARIAANAYESVTGSQYITASMRICQFLGCSMPTEANEMHVLLASSPFTLANVATSLAFSADGKPTDGGRELAVVRLADLKAPGATVTFRSGTKLPVDRDILAAIPRLGKTFMPGRCCISSDESWHMNLMGFQPSDLLIDKTELFQREQSREHVCAHCHDLTHVEKACPERAAESGTCLMM